MKKIVELDRQELTTIVGGSKKDTHFDIKKILQGFFGGKGLI